MALIGELLDPEAVKAAEAVSNQVAPTSNKVAPKPRKKARKEAAKSKQESNEVAPFLSGVTVQRLVVDCDGECGATVTVVDRPVPDDVADLPRYRVCVECAQKMTEGKTGRVLERRPLTLNGQSAVVVNSRPKRATTEKKEAHMGQINVSDAELGAAVRQLAQETVAEALPEKQKKAKSKKAKKDKAEKAAKRSERADLSKIGVLDGFTIKNVEVPALDVGAIGNLDEAVPSEVRSPYNKARHRMKQNLLPSATAAQIKKDPTTPHTTWVMLIPVHQELAAKAGNVAEAKAEKPEKRKLVAAPIDLDEKTRVRVLRESFGVDKATARRMLAEIR